MEGWEQELGAWRCHGCAWTGIESIPPYYSHGTEGSELNLSLRKLDDFMAFQIYKATGDF